MARIVYLEDDHLLAEDVTSEMEKEFPGTEVKGIRTESEFRRHLPEIISNPPDLVIMDVMLRWTDPAPDMDEAPADVISEGRFSAGVRCQRLLAEKAPNIPVLFFTVLDEGDLAKFRQGSTATVPYVQKSHERSHLMEAIKKTLSSK